MSHEVHVFFGPAESPGFPVTRFKKLPCFLFLEKEIKSAKNPKRLKEVVLRRPEKVSLQTWHKNIYQLWVSAQKTGIEASIQDIPT